VTEVSRKEAMESVVPAMNAIYKYYNEKYDTEEMVNNIHKFFCVGTPVSTYSMALSVAYGVQNLYYKTVRVLGTEKHQSALKESLEN
jgi:hypothetical protein